MADIPQWRPDRLAARRPFLAARALMLRAVRGFFEAGGYLEAETPCLQAAPGMEVHLHGLRCDVTLKDGRRVERWLATSPEFALKKLIAGGFTRLYQIGPVFRDRDVTPLHQPEFRLLEWYRTGGSLDDLMDETEALIRHCAQALGVSASRRGDLELFLDAPFERLSVAEALARETGLALADLGDRPSLVAAMAGLGLDTPDDLAWPDLFLDLVSQRVEPALGRRRPTFLFDWPAPLASLARRRPEAPDIAERVELHAGGLELCNGFRELTDAEEQRARFTRDRAEKQRLYGTDQPIDEDFLAALAHGLPDCVGNALGLDRLAMLLTGAVRIDQVLWEPVVPGD